MAKKRPPKKRLRQRYGYAWETITPKKAAKLLESVTGKPRVSQRSIDRFAKDMMSGQWKHGREGHPIVISNKGRLLDGRARIWAVLRSGTTQKFIVLYGAPASTAKLFNYYEKNRSR